MTASETHPSTGDGLRVRDNLPVGLTRLDPEQAAEAESGHLAAAVDGLRASLGSREATVEDMIRDYPPDQRPQGPTFEALRLVDAKLNHILRLLEEQEEQGETDGPEPLPVEISLDSIRAGLPLTSGFRPGQGEWYWLDCRLPGSPRTHFAAPARVIGAGEAPGEDGDNRYWVTLALANVTETEEKVLSEYIFRRHRQEVRQRRHAEEG